MTLRADDVLDEYITIEQARAGYGVVIADDMTVNVVATARERQARRGAA